MTMETPTSRNVVNVSAAMSTNGRRQSLPETMLTNSHHSSSLFNQSSSDRSISIPRTVTSNRNIMVDEAFKRSEGGRFERKSKRKSQSLYEASGGQQQHQHFQGLVSDAACNKVEENDRMETANSSHSKLKAENLSEFQAPAVPAVTANTAASVNRFAPIEATNQGPQLHTQISPERYLLEEKHGRIGEQGEDDNELDFLLSFPKRHHEREQKNEMEHEGDLGIFNRSGPRAYKGSPPKMRRSVIETRSDNYTSYHSAPPLFDDVFHNPAASSSMPSVPAYDNFSNFNPLNNLHSFTHLNTSNMNAFQVNPINNFGVNNFGYDNVHGLNNFGRFFPGDAESGAEIKKRRSRVPSSVYRGVSRCGKDNKYQARIRVHGKVKYLGRFKSEVEAAKCYDKHAIEYLGVNAQTNFPYTPKEQASA